MEEEVVCARNIHIFKEKLDEYSLRILPEQNVLTAGGNPRWLPWRKCVEVPGPRGTDARAEMETMSCEGTIEVPEQDRGAVHCHTSQRHSKGLLTQTSEGMGSRSFRLGHKVRKVGKNYVIILEGNMSEQHF